MILTNLKYNEMKQELKVLRVHNRTMRDVLEQIAASNRGGGNKRLASSCLSFIEHALKPPMTLGKQPKGKG